MRRLKVCAIQGCYNTNKLSGVSFYSVEKHPESVAWSMLVDPKMLWQVKHLFVCSAHFLREQFKDPSCTSKGVRRTAIPCLKLGQGHEEAFYRDEDIPVSVEVEVEDLPETEDEVPLNNNGLSRKKLPHVDHNYCMNAMTVQALHEVIERLMKKLRKSSKKVRNQSISLRRARISALSWRKRALGLRVALHSRISRVARDTNQSGFLDELVVNSKKPARGVRYSNATKNIAIGLFYCSPNGYRELRKLLRLPSPSMIKKWLQRLAIAEGFNETVLSLLTNQAQLFTRRQKVVIISIDEMTLKAWLQFNGKADSISGYPTRLDGEQLNVEERASSVLVVQIRCLETGHKQCIAYFFSSKGFKADQLKKIVELSVEKISATGLIPKALVLDQNSTNRSLYTKLGVSENSPFFEHADQKIYCFYDPPHLIKSTRNNLMHHGAVYNGKLAKWEHLRLLYFEDSKRLPRAVPKLKQGHVFMPAFGEMRVPVATQTISATVYAAILTYVLEGFLPKECEATAMYCKDFNDLYDCFNASPASRHVTKELAEPLRAGSKHWAIFDSMIPKLRSLRFIDRNCGSLEEESSFKSLPKSSRKPWFVSGWLLNIAAIRAMFTELTTEFGFTELSTRALNQDGLENFFGLIRMKNLNNNRPDCGLFAASYRIAVVNQMLTSKGKGNCEQDSGVNLFQLKHFAEMNVSFRNFTPAEPDSEQANACLEVFDVGQVHNTTYTAAWLSRTLTHEECISTLEQSAQSHSRLAELKDRALTSNVSTALLEFVQHAEKVFKQEFTGIVQAGADGVKRRMMPKILSGAPRILCSHCEKELLDRYLNMLFKAKCSALNEELKTKNKTKKKEKTRELAKAKKLNI